MTAFRKTEMEVPRNRLLKTLASLEAQGCFGIRFEWGGELVPVVSWSGKEGPCYESGRDAVYEGPCMAVGDDDNHFVAGRIRVCEKTGGVYASEAYSKFLRVTQADPEKLASIDTDPIPFNCDTLSTDAESIARRVKTSALLEESEESFILCGPFRYVVLESGAILRRGIPAMISRGNAEILEASGYGMRAGVAAPRAARFADLYDRFGPLFLVGRGSGDAAINLPDLGSLSGISEIVRARIRRMIDKDENYIMLQGTDPGTGGCCPLPDVGECNALVRSGLFSAWKSPMSGACPVTAYSIAGEILDDAGPMPVFGRNGFLRLSVREAVD